MATWDDSGVKIPPELLATLKGNPVDRLNELMGIAGPVAAGRTWAEKPGTPQPGSTTPKGVEASKPTGEREV